MAIQDDQQSLNYKNKMMKEKYNLMRSQYEDLKSSLSPDVICESHRKEIYQLRKQILQR